MSNHHDNCLDLEEERSKARKMCDSCKLRVANEAGLILTGITVYQQPSTEIGSHLENQIDSYIN